MSISTVDSYDVLYDDSYIARFIVWRYGPTLNHPGCEDSLAAAEPRENHVTRNQASAYRRAHSSWEFRPRNRRAELTIVNPPNLHDPSPNGYSTAVIVPAGARVAYISGQGGQDSTGALSPDFATQVKQAYANLRTALDGIGARPDQVAKLTVFVVDHDMSKLGVLTSNVKEMFGEALAGADPGSRSQARDRPHALRGGGRRRTEIAAVGRLCRLIWMSVARGPHLSVIALQCPAYANCVCDLTRCAEKAFARRPALPATP